MNTRARRLPFAAAAGFVALAASGCSSVNNVGSPGSPATASIPVQGTIFTIMFENHDSEAVLGESPATQPSTYFAQLADQYGSAAAFLDEGIHPSLPNYIVTTSGDQHNIHDDNDPSAHSIGGTDNLPAQLDAAHIGWRSYQESMGDACGLVSHDQYAAKHNPFVYYNSVTDDMQNCRDHVVDFDANFQHDLDSNAYRYMWVTPNMCNDMHDCGVATSEAWLRRVIPQIQASAGYRNGGAIFIMFDEGSIPLFGRRANIAAIVISPNIVRPGFVSNVTYDHQSYLATVQDAFGLPRLPGTQAATPMADFFAPASSTTTTTTPTDGGTVSP